MASKFRLLDPNDFAKFLMERAEAKDGYILCSVGQDPRKLSSWYYEQYSGKQLEKALYWKTHAKRVWDCQGLADGYASEQLGQSINVRARNNYSEWCSTKGKGRIPKERRIAGAAVFIHNGDYISHVGFLVRPVDEKAPEGDWFVVEARGVMYGVVTTQLYNRKWTHWGWMDKMFDYTNTSVTDKVTHEPDYLHKGCKGDDVRTMQEKLINLGYSCGKYGADGDFGSSTLKAVKKFQKDHGITETGIVDESTIAAIERDIRPVMVEIVGGQCWARTEPNGNAKRIGVAAQGSKYEYLGDTSENGWLAIKYDGQPCWVSGKYGKIITQ